MEVEVGEADKVVTRNKSTDCDERISQWVRVTEQTSATFETHISRLLGPDYSIQLLSTGQTSVKKAGPGMADGKLATLCLISSGISTNCTSFWWMRIYVTVYRGL